MKCPSSSCDYESNERGVKTHYGRSHDDIPPWQKQTCDYCGSHFSCPQSTAKKGNGIYCSRSCASKDRDHSNNFVKVECKVCSKEISLYPSHVSKKNFCSHSCHGDWLAGLPEEKSPAYKGGGRERYYAENWQEQREKALERDDNRCTYDECSREVCESGQPLHVHHIKPARLFDELAKAHKLENLRTLCAEHHAKIEP